jgi:hypothetical protein
MVARTFLWILTHSHKKFAVDDLAEMGRSMLRPNKVKGSVDES